LLFWIKETAMRTCNKLLGKRIEAIQTGQGAGGLRPGLVRGSGGVATGARASV
jgi:hypothetical protein